MGSTPTGGRPPVSSRWTRRVGGATCRRGPVAAIAGLLLALGGNAPAASAEVRTHPLFPPLARNCSTTFLGGDFRLGPDQLQIFGRVGPMLVGYNRLAGLTPEQFISTYWDPTASGGKGGWRYPPDNGYVLIAGHPDEFVTRLASGAELDRFGSEFGGFLAPEDTPYARRSLPPQNLDTADPDYPCNYHLYRVLKPFAADEGPIAPGFGQPGLGFQIQLDGSLVPGAPSQLNVMWMIDNGYLTRGT